MTNDANELPTEQHARAEHQMIDYGRRMRQERDEARAVIERVKETIEREWTRLPDGTEAVTVHRLNIALGESARGRVVRRQSVQTEVIALLADGHWWTCRELADCIDVHEMEVQAVIEDFEERGFVRRFDDERPVMYGWTVEMQAAEAVAQLKAECDDRIDAMRGRWMTLVAEGDEQIRKLHDEIERRTLHGKAGCYICGEQHLEGFMTLCPSCAKGAIES